jgi:hypothetical protein
LRARLRAAARTTSLRDDGWKKRRAIFGLSAPDCYNERSGFNASRHYLAGSFQTRLPALAHLHGR